MILYQGVTEYFNESLETSFNLLLKVIKTEISRLGWHILTIENGSQLYESVKDNMQLWFIHMIIKVFILFPIIILFSTTTVFFGIPLLMTITLFGIFMFLFSRFVNVYVAWIKQKYL